jgi:hypothetical protein
MLFDNLSLLIERNPPSPGWPGDRLRWRKEQMAYRPSSELPERPRAEIETDAHIEGNLATEVSFIILDTLERIVQVKIIIKFTAVVVVVVVVVVMMMMMMRLCSHIPSVAA